MSTELTIESTSTAPRGPSSHAWFCWKETRQLAPLLMLLLIVSFLIVLFDNLVGVMSGAMSFRLPNEVTMLVFPALFATGAGPLLVGQERAQRTLDWLILLPIASRRVMLTKLVVGATGLAVMWCFSVFVIIAFDLRSPDTSWFSIRRSYSTSGNPFSFPVWFAHSFYVLLAGFFVAWRIKNQFYSLIALIPVAFAPMIATTMLREMSRRPVMAADADWLNLVFTFAGLAVLAPLTYRAAIRTLGADAAPSIKPLVGERLSSPAHETDDAIAPRFGTQIAPIIWQSIHSARGTLLLLIGLLLISFLALVRASDLSTLRGPDELLPWLMLSGFLAISWLGVTTFKYDGSSERIRFLADRGVGHRRTFFAMHAVPLAVICASITIYGVWNLSVTLRSRSGFVAELPTVLTLSLILFGLYSVSQWVSQFIRTLVLAVILAPIVSVVVIGWMMFALLTIGFPLYAVAGCILIPLLATYFLMPRYMDSTDRPWTFFVAMIVIGLIVLAPIGHAAWRITSVPGIDPAERDQLLAEARQLTLNRLPLQVISSVNFAAHDPTPSYLRDPLKEFYKDRERFTLDPQEVIAPLVRNRQSAAALPPWEYARLHGAIVKARITYEEDPGDESWQSLASWMEMSGTLLVGLRRSWRVIDQETADRLEVLLIDILEDDAIAERRDDSSYQLALDSIGTRESRNQARRRAVFADLAGRSTERSTITCDWSDAGSTAQP